MLRSKSGKTCNKFITFSLKLKQNNNNSCFYKVKTKFNSDKKTYLKTDLSNSSFSIIKKKKMIF